MPSLTAVRARGALARGPARATLTELRESSLPASWARPVGAPPLIIGHRGASALAAENSIEAFHRAAADGADGVELDVLLAAGGEVVVFHDDDLARLGGRPDRIADLSLAELRAVRLRSGAAIPLLDEVLEACGPRLLINVELKAAGISAQAVRALVERVAAIVEGGGPALGSRILVSSFHPGAIRAWQRRAPRVRAGLLFEREAPVALRRAWALPFLRPFAVHPEGVLCTPSACRRWKRRGYHVNVWTVDAPEDVRRFAALGVDGIITNDPARTRAALPANSARPAAPAS